MYIIFYFNFLDIYAFFVILLFIIIIIGCNTLCISMIKISLKVCFIFKIIVNLHSYHIFRIYVYI